MVDEADLRQVTFDDELERQEGRPVDEPHWRAKMWRRSYNVALYAMRILNQRIARLERLTGPMIFFYPEYDR